MNVPYLLPRGSNESTWSHSTIKDALYTLSTMVLANVGEHMNLSTYPKGPESEFIMHDQDDRIQIGPGLDENNKFTLTRDHGSSILEQGNVSCYEIR